MTYLQPWMALLLADEHRQRDMVRAADPRRAHRPAKSLRRALGHRIIAIGARVAAEPPLELARSR
jgi:hypothetical protein